MEENITQLTRSFIRNERSSVQVIMQTSMEQMKEKQIDGHGRQCFDHTNFSEKIIKVHTEKRNTIFYLHEDSKGL